MSPYGEETMVNRGSKLLLVVLLAAGGLLAAGAVVAQDHHGSAEPPPASHAESGQQTDAEPGAATADPHAAADAARHGEAEHHDEEHGAEHGGHGAIPHAPNIVTLIASLLHDEQGEPSAAARFLVSFVDPIFSLIVAGLLAGFFIRLRRNLDPRNPSRLQVLAEVILGGLYSLFRQIIGPTAHRYTPYLGTLFIFIICNNLMGLVPLGHSSTASFQNTTFALGLATFFYVQGIAIKENGVLGYLHHMAGSPRTPMDWGFSLLLFPLHVLGELIKPISLSLRLFGNIFGEDTLIATMVILGYLLVKSIVGSEWVVGLPIQFPFYFLGLLGSTIQALVFALLSTVYIALMLPHGEHHEEDYVD
jgi:F-type H+-transporting ATPase subunit a